jgi:superfamily II helicase
MKMSKNSAYIRKKTCHKCRKSKRVTHFTEAAGNADGYKNYCKPCAAEIARRFRAESDTRGEFINAAILTDIEKRPSIARQMRL